MRWRPSPFLTVVVVLAVVPVVVGLWWYGDRSIWPGWIGNFSATLLAFLAALYADRKWATQQARDASELEDERRVTEARRAFLAISSELIEVSFELDAAIPRLTPGDEHEWWVLPNLPTRAWEALAPRLGVIISDVQLIADLSAYSAKVDDLRWALRYRLEKGSETVGTTLTVSLSNWARIQAEATRNDLNELLPRVTKQASHPEVRPVGVTLSSGVHLRQHSSLTVSAKVIRADDPPSAEE
jgi:hypothetical protein